MPYCHKKIFTYIKFQKSDFVYSWPKLQTFQATNLLNYPKFSSLNFSALFSFKFA